MSCRSRLALTVLLSALVLGVLADLLLRVGLGINILLFLTALLAVVVGIRRGLQVPLTGEGRWLLPLLLLFAAGIAWRDSPTLQGLDLAAIAVILALGAFRARSGSLRLATVSEYPNDLILAVGQAVIGVPCLVRADIQWQELPRGPWRRTTTQALLGLLLALPLLFIFGALLASADPHFGRMLSRFFQVEPEDLVDHLTFAAAGAWLSAAWLRTLLLRERSQVTVNRKAQEPVIGPVGVAIALGLVDLLFAAFVLVQVQSLLGGTGPARTYSAAARGGFFELVDVTALSLPVLLGIHWLSHRDGKGAGLSYPIAAGLQVGLLFAIMASALQRMFLYTEAYGLTELRFYSTVFMLYLAAVLLWLCATVLCGRRERFAFGALAAALLTIVLLHLINPDALIVRMNAGRPDQRQGFDSDYAAQLSTDAVPTLIDALPQLHPNTQERVRRDLKALVEHTDADWRAWNWSRWYARRALGPLLER